MEKTYDLVICVYACDTINKYKNQILKTNETWGKIANEHDNIKLLYFLGEEKTDLNGPNYINLPNVKNDYLSASYKQFLGLKYIYENIKTKFVIICGADTYLNIKKLMILLIKFNHNDNLYIGGYDGIRKIGNEKVYFHTGGPGIIITYNALEKLYPLLENLMDDWINICITKKVEYLIPACDVGISYYLQMKNTTIINRNFNFVDCNYKFKKGYTNNELRKLLRIENIIGCHNMDLQDFDDYTSILEKNNYYV